MGADRADQQHRRIEVEGRLQILAEQGEPGVLCIVSQSLARGRAGEAVSGHGLHVVDQFVDKDRQLRRAAAGPARRRSDKSCGISNSIS